MGVLTCFKTYDVRGKLGEELNEDIAYRIGRAYGQVLKPRRIVVGADVRLTSESLKQALSKGLMDAGVDVIDIGLAGTEEVYFAAFYLEVDGGIEVTASHNPIDYNGMKFVGKGAVPISRENGLGKIQTLAESQNFEQVKTVGTLKTKSILDDYVHHLLGYIAIDKIRPLKIVVNAGNGAAGHVIDMIEQQFTEKSVPIVFVKINHEPNGKFPRGIPNPLLPENRQDTIDAVINHKADFGIAWDGDFDRCFFFDHEGAFVEGYYMVGLIAQAMLKKHPHEKIIYDPRLTWNTEALVKEAGGIAIQSKTGHVFIKERMRVENAIYGGEMSAHHYFKDFAYCDSGMIPWLILVALISDRGQTLRQMVADGISRFPCSGEINFDINQSIDDIVRWFYHKYQYKSVRMTNIDGLTVECNDWRFNIRGSNTEPLLRLNIETKGSESLLLQKQTQLFEQIEQLKSGEEVPV